MYFHQVPRDREPKSEPSVLASRSTVGLTKSIEDIRQKLFINALPGIRNRDFNRAARSRHLHAHAPATLRKLHRIRHEFQTTCCSLFASPEIISGRRVEIRLDSMPFASAVGRTTLIAFSTTGTTSNGCRSR